MRVTVDEGVALEVDLWEGGDGAPFLAAHGLASNRRLWEGVAARLHELGHPVATVDLRGHGRSDKPENGYDFATMGDDLVDVLDAIGFDRVVLAGQSTGGNLVVDLAARLPERVVGVAGIDGGALELARQWPDWEQCKEALAPPPLAGSPAASIEARLRRGHPGWSDWAIEASMANFEHLPDGTIRPWLSLERHLRILRALWEHRPSAVIPRLDVPVLLVMADTGDSWAEQKRTISDELVAVSAHVRAQWFSPGDHDLHLQYPIELADLLHAAFT
ncbi:MAG: alpha/beta fold hydrolase [Acidimicrobiales bacterium]